MTERETLILTRSQIQPFLFQFDRLVNLTSLMTDIFLAK